MKSGNPAGQGGAFQGVGNSDSTGSTASHATAELARVLNYQPGERISLNWQQRPGGRFTSRIVDAADLPAAIEQAPEQSCTWIGINPTRATSGRGRADTVTRLAAIVYELDYDDDKGCTREQGAAIADELDRLIWPATAVVESGHGQHFYIPTAGGTITDKFTRADAATLLARFRRLLVAVARKHGAADPDNVTELARVMRAPGTTNWKCLEENVTGPHPVTISIRAGATTPTVDMIRGYLDAAEVEYPPEPERAPRERASSSAPTGGSDRLRRYALNTLEREAAELAGMAPETGRNNKLNDAALRCYRLADGAGMDRASVTATLRAAAQQSGTPGIEGTLRSAASKADAAGPAYPPDNELGSGDGGNTTFDPGPSGADDGNDDGSEQPRYTDFSWLLTGRKPRRPTPELLHRDDGHAIFYRGKRNELYGDPEDGKTMIAEAAAAEELAAGGRVVFIDLDHNGEDETAERLLMLGAPLEAIADPNRFRHIEPDDAAHVVQIVADCTAWAATMAIIDCAGELIPLFNGSNDSADDYTRVMRVTAAPLESAGAAVILIDHLAKGADSRSYGAGGTMAKRRAVSGASIKVTNRQKFRRGHGGAAELWINKDRPGGLREHCEPTPPGKRQQYAGTFTLEPADPDTGRADWTVTTDQYAGDDTTTVDPHLEKHYTAAVDLLDAGQHATAQAVAAAVNDPTDDTAVRMNQKKVARRALDRLTGAARLVSTGAGTNSDPRRWELPA